MYLNWARLKGFEAKIIHEKLASPKLTREIILLIEGVAIYGLLRGEAGMHEMVFGRTPKHAKQTRYVKVRVLPVVDSDDSEIPDSEISLEKHKARGTGLRCRRYKSTVTITHRPSATSFSITSELTPDEAAPLIEDLLHSELAHRQSLESSALEPGEESAMVEDIIRKYSFNPRPSARDARTGVTTHNLSELWKGALDEFLYASLRERSGNHPAGN
jgi:peptide chain release factor 2